MNEKFKNKYRTQSTRLQNWDYSWNGRYFITICTKNRKHFLGKIKNGIMYHSKIGQLAQKYWDEIPAHFQHVKLGEFMVMPDHIHGIVIIEKPWEDSYWRNNLGGQRFQNQGKGSLSAIIGSYKSIVSKFAKKIEPKFGWHPKFNDKIIRDDRAFNNISKYIKNNPKNWKKV